MNRIILYIGAMLLLVGCGATPKVYQQSKPVKLTMPKSVTIYGQKLLLSPALRAKAFKKIEKTARLEGGNNVEGKESSKAYSITTPLHLHFNFDKPYRIYKVDTSKLLHLSDTTIAKHAVFADLRAVTFTLDNEQSDIIYLTQMKKFLDVPFKTATTDLTLSIKELFPDNDLLDERSYIVDANDCNVTFVVYDASYEGAILKETLRRRDNPKKNEALLHKISKDNFQLYYEIHAKRSEYKLPEVSMINLPEDADLEYAREHYKNFAKTGKYRTMDGKYTIVMEQEAMEFDKKSVGVEKTRTIKTDKSNKSIKKAGEIPEADDFIDFSEGVK